MLEEKLQKHLEEFEKTIPEIIATNIVKQDGFSIVNTGKKGYDSKRYAAMTAGLFGISQRTMNALEGGNLAQTYIKGKEIEIILVSIPGKKMFVSVITSKDPNIGLIIYQLEELVNKLKEVL
ncbi:MAG: roadblock/LC7 domain-containing protein [Candidatus Lokiarchaeota archaeon]